MRSTWVSVRCVACHEYVTIDNDEKREDVIQTSRIMNWLSYLSVEKMRTHSFSCLLHRNANVYSKFWLFFVFFWISVTLSVSCFYSFPMLVVTQIFVLHTHSANKLKTTVLGVAGWLKWIRCGCRCERKQIAFLNYQLVNENKNKFHMRVPT